MNFVKPFTTPASASRESCTRGRGTDRVEANRSEAALREETKWERARDRECERALVEWVEKQKKQKKQQTRDDVLVLITVSAPPPSPLSSYKFSPSILFPPLQTLSTGSKYAVVSNFTRHIVDFHHLFKNQPRPLNLSSVTNQYNFLFSHYCIIFIILIFCYVCCRFSM